MQQTSLCQLYEEILTSVNCFDIDNKNVDDNVRGLCYLVSFAVTLKMSNSTLYDASPKIRSKNNLI